MTSVLTVAMTGSNTSSLEAKFFPEIQLDDDAYEYSCALIDLIVKNVEETNKLFNSGMNRIDCDIISGSYINGMQCNAIHQFTVSTSNVKHETLVEIPIHLNYFPIKIRKNLRVIQLAFVDKKGVSLNIQGDIYCRISIKRVIRARENSA